MVVLALETVTRAGSLAVSIDGACHAMAGEPARTHAERLPGELIDFLARFGRRLQDVDEFAIIAGPGSFTGLRVGMAAIQGLAISTGRKIVPVPTLEAMALGWMAYSPDAPSGSGIIVACLDGQRGEVFSAAWRATDHGALSEQSMMIAPQVGTLDSLAASLRAFTDRGPIVLVGDGARRQPASWPPGTTIVDLPVTLAEVAVREAVKYSDRGVTPHALKPIYIRRPDAVLARERAAGVPRS
jgi:tRNA threonylcarbamoyladenosine biosynthesis protein TsaB